MKKCIRCKKLGNWWDDMCGNCKAKVKAAELYKSPLPFGNRVSK